MNFILGLMCFFWGFLSSHSLSEELSLLPYMMIFPFILVWFVCSLVNLSFHLTKFQFFLILLLFLNYELWP